MAEAAHATASVQIQSEVTPREIYIGDPIQYRVTIVCSSDVAPAPLKLEKNWGAFELLDTKTLMPAPTKDGKQSLRHVLLLTTFSTGAVTIPSLSLKFSMPDGTFSEAKTEEINVKVKSLLEEKGDEGHLRPLKGLFNFRSYKWIWIILGILGGVIVLVLLYRLRKNKGKLFQKPAPPPRPAEDVALEAIELLEKEGLIAEKQFKEFYFRLSVICRNYLEARYGVAAIERTTSELLVEFRRLNLALDVANLLRDLFENADLVKFAKFSPKDDDVKIDLSRARRFVDLTTPKIKVDTKGEKIPV
jgi:hypothetical protein